METGRIRVTDPDDQHERELAIEAAAAELADIQDDVAEARRVIAWHDGLVKALREAVQVDTPVPAGEGRTVTLVAVGGKRQVNGGVCETHRDALIRAGASREVVVPASSHYTNPKVSELEDPAMRAKLLALGVPLSGPGALVAMTGGRTELIVTDLNAEQEAA